MAPVSELLLLLWGAVGASAAAPPLGKAPVALDLSPRIVGGKPVNIANYPFMVSVQLNDWHACGGTILNRYWVLTSAHCLCNAKTGRRMQLTVLAGSSVSDTVAAILDAQIVDALQFRLVVRVAFAPRKGDGGGGGGGSCGDGPDVGVAQVNRPYEWTRWVQPVVLSAGAAIQAGEVCATLGWGHVRPRPTISQREKGARDEPAKATLTLNLVELPLITTELCQEYYAHVKDEWHMCTLAEGKDACNGDSGGPLLCGNRQVALVAGGDGCAQSGVPGVYERVRLLLRWLREVRAQKPKSDAPASDSSASLPASALFPALLLLVLRSAAGA